MRFVNSVSLFSGCFLDQVLYTLFKFYSNKKTGLYITIGISLLTPPIDRSLRQP